MPSKFTNYNTAKPLKEFPVKGSLASRMKDKVVDKVSDVMSYPARRAAQKSMLQSDAKFNALRGAREAGKAVGKQGLQKAALKESAAQKFQRTDPKGYSSFKKANPKLEYTQEDENHFQKNYVQPKRYSNGIGVGP